MTYTVPTCEVEGCTGHLGKFGDCYDEALFEASMDGMLDYTGESDFGGTYYLFIVEDPEAVEGVEPYSVTLDRETPNEREVVVPPGFYILDCDDQGFVRRLVYETEAEARRVYAEIEERYSAWSSEDEDDTESDTDTEKEG